MNNVTSEKITEKEALLNELRSMETSIDQMAEQNAHIVSHDLDLESQKKVEHFQYQFMVQKERIDQMKHNVKLGIGSLSAGAKDLEEYTEYFHELQGEFKEFSSLYR